MVAAPASASLWQTRRGSELDDPAKAAQPLLTIVDAKIPLLSLFLGDDALGIVDGKLEAMNAEIAVWEAVARLIGFAS